MYRLSHHAQQRIKERHLHVRWLLAALDGKRARLPDGTLVLCDPVSRCALYINEQRMLIITAMRLQPSKYKRIYSARRKSSWHR